MRSLNVIIGLFIDRSYAHSVSGARVGLFVFLFLGGLKTPLNKRGHGCFEMIATRRYHLLMKK